MGPAEELWPAFEKRLQELGYGPLAIAHAFSTLKGPGTVAEALAELAENARFERSVPVALEFEAVEQEPALPAGHALTVTGVQRDSRGIRVMYTIRPPVAPQLGAPRAVARDDLDREYANTGAGFVGLAEPVDRTTGGFTMPLPQPDARVLRLRMSWSRDLAPLWDRSALELRITL